MIPLFLKSQVVNATSNFKKSWIPKVKLVNHILKRDENDKRHQHLQRISYKSQTPVIKSCAQSESLYIAITGSYIDTHTISRKLYLTELGRKILRIRPNGPLIIQTCI